MCWEHEKFTETRVTDTIREEELEKPETWPEPVEEPAEIRERERELAEV